MTSQPPIRQHGTSASAAVPVTDVAVRRATVADKARIFSFLQEAYGARAVYKFPDRWEWEFEDNPFRDPDRLPVWIALDDGRIVGQTCAMIEPIQIGSHVRRVAWSVDTFVLPEYRGRGIGRRLQQAGQSAADVFMSMRMSAKNRRIKQSLGARPLAPVSVMQMRLRADGGDVVRRLSIGRTRMPRLVRRLRLDVAAAGAYTASRRLGWAVRSRGAARRLSDLQVEAVRRFDSEIDLFWRSVAPGYQLAVCRDARRLNWKFCRQPHMDHNRFVFRRGGEICGYVILRQASPPEHPVGIIVDLVAHSQDDDATSALAAFAVRRFVRDRIPVVKALAATETHRSVYGRLGFREIGRLTPMFHASSPPAVPPDPPAALFSYGDHDLDQYPLA